MGETLLTVAQAAKRLNVSRPTVYRRIYEGSLPALRIGNENGLLRIDPAALEAWLDPPHSEATRERGGERRPVASHSGARGRMNQWTTSYRVARSFEAGGRTFRRGEILRGDDPAVSFLLRVETLLGRQLLLVMTQLADRPALSSNAQETVAWRAKDSDRHSGKLAEVELNPERPPIDEGDLGRGYTFKRGEEISADHEAHLDAPGCFEPVED